MTTYTKESKPTATIIYEERAGEAGNTTWDDTAAAWDAALIYWDNLLPTTTSAKETKPTTNYNKETRP